MFLVLGRAKKQKIMIGDDIEVTVLRIGSNRVTFGVKAPDHVYIASRLKGTEQPILDVESETTDGNDPSTITGVTSISSRS